MMTDPQTTKLKMLQTDDKNEEIDFNVNKNNLAQYLKQNRVIKDLPKDALVSLNLYNFDSGSKQIEKSYIITKANVIEGQAKNPDLIISIDSKYVSMINSAGFCLTIQNAKLNRDMDSQYKISSNPINIIK